jgi:excisionase family DNA binding protein
MDRPLNSREAASFLGISLGSLHNLMHKKKITYYKPGGKLAYFREKDLRRFMYQNRCRADWDLEIVADQILNR